MSVSDSRGMWTSFGVSAPLAECPNDSGGPVSYSPGPGPRSATARAATDRRPSTVFPVLNRCRERGETCGRRRTIPPSGLELHLPRRSGRGSC
jgi:hypothetical protein